MVTYLAGLTNIQCMFMFIASLEVFEDKSAGHATGARGTLEPVLSIFFLCKMQHELHGGPLDT
jgi:hypothetical protein